MMMVIARPEGEYQGDPDHRYFGPFQNYRTAERCSEGLQFLGYSGEIVMLENFDAVWRSTTWNEEKGIRE